MRPWNDVLILQYVENGKITDIENTIFNRIGVPQDLQRIIHRGRQLEPSRKMSDYSIEKDSILYLVLRLRGGGLAVFLVDPDGTIHQFDSEPSLAGSDF